MSASSPPALSENSSITAEQVAAYLQRHPDFFVQHPEILTAVRLPAHIHETATIKDFQAFQIDSLRAKLSCLRETALGNQHLFQDVQRCILALFSCRSLTEIWTCLTKTWPPLLGVEMATLAVEKPKGMAIPMPFADLPVVPPTTITRLHRTPLPASTRVAVVLNAAAGGSRFLFGVEGLDIASDALIVFPSGAERQVGLILAFASTHTQHFSPEQGTEYLHFLGEAVYTYIQTWITHSPQP